MKPATVASSLLLGLLALAGAHTFPTATEAQTAVPASPQPRPAPGQPVQGATVQALPPQPAAQQAPRPGAATRSGERRKRSYAACNRLSQSRGLRGGVRRRFLIRCKLGYERPRAVPPQLPPARQP